MMGFAVSSINPCFLRALTICMPRVHGCFTPVAGMVFPHAGRGKVMTRVLVVGADVDGERVLLERLHRMAGLPMGSLQACRDLDECELLIVRNSPGLVNAAQRMRMTRPGIRLWVESQDGALLDGAQQALPKLPATEILSVLNGHARVAANSEPLHQQEPEVWHQPPASLPTRAAIIAAPASDASPRIPTSRDALTSSHAVHTDDIDAGRSGIQGSFALARALRSGIRQRQGSALLYDADRPVLAIDFSSAQAVPLLPVMQQGLAEAAQWLGGRLSQLRLVEISADKYLGHEQQGQRLPLRALLWQAAQQMQDWERVDAQLEQGAVIHLQGWPDFRVLARQQDVFRLCSLLVRKPSSQAECVHLLDLAPATVQAFVHGAFLSGYVRLDEVSKSAFEQVRQDMRNVPAQPRGGLLARMWRSVRAAAGGN